MWQQIEISGKAAEAFLPENSSAEHAIIYLHAHGEERLSEKDEFTQLFAEYGYPVICPRGKKSWWVDRLFPQFDSEITPMQYVRDDVVKWIGDNLGIAPPRIALLGISMGGQGVLNLSYRYALQFPIVAAISSAVDYYKAYGHGFPLDSIYESAEQARQDGPTLHIHPLNWPKHQFFACDPMDPTWYNGNQILASKLSSSGVMYECDLKTSHGGHHWEYFTPMAGKALEFIDKAFQRVR